MSAHSLIIQYTASAGPVVEDGYWLRLEQDPLVEDTATNSDAARLIDAVFQVDPCVDDAETTAKKVETVKNKIAMGVVEANELIAEAAKAVLDLAICDQESDGSVEVEIKVILSHPDEPYQLRISGGEVMETVLVETEIAQAITVQEATNHTLDFPVIAGFSGQWASNVVTASGQAPLLGRTGNTLHWPVSATGTLVCSYQTRYALVKVKVFGVDGEQGSALVRCFYHGLVEELEPEMPEPAEFDTSLCGHGNSRIELPDERVTCYKTIVVSKRCGCSKKEIGSTTYDQVVPCPDWAPIHCPDAVNDCMHLLGTEGVTEYVDCTGDGDSSLASEATYRELCCNTTPPANLPDCTLEKRVWKGGAPIVGGIDSYRQIYGKNVRIVPVSPNGGICGEWAIKQMVTATNCCDLVDPPVWNNDVSAQVLSDNSQATVMWSHSLGPYTVRVRGAGFWLDAARSKKIVTTAVPWAEVYTSAACGSCAVLVEDACGNQVTGAIRATNGQWVAVISDWSPERVQGASVFLSGNDPRLYTHETVEGSYKVRKESLVVQTQTDGFIPPVQPLYSNQYFRANCSNIISRYVGPTLPSIGHDPGNGDIPGLNSVGPTSSITNPFTNINYYMQYCSAWMFYPGVRWTVWEWQC